MKYAQFQQEDRRLSFLLALDQVAGYEANHFLLVKYLDQLGHPVSHDLVITEGNWLAEQGLVSASVAGDIHVFTLTTRGVDCAAGKVLVHGVKRPMPGGA